MKSYKDYEKKILGTSDVSTLVLVGMVLGVVTPVTLRFGADATYTAYVVDNDAKIGDHYSEVARFSGWMKVYDDDGCAASFNSDEIVVYRAERMGCIIRLG